jgi:tRNA (adenine57-N1/adenine58-N1)-methyltransferase catalytic subunit
MTNTNHHLKNDSIYLSSQMNIKKLVITKDFRIYPIDSLQRSYSFTEGSIDREEFIKHNHQGIINTTKNHPMLVIDADFSDNYRRLKRGPACILPKDIGHIIAETAITKDSVILDAGAGMGASVCLLAGLCKKVYTCDVNEKHLEITKENAKSLNLTNIEFSHCSVTEIQLPELVDLVLLDVPNPLETLPDIKHKIRQGGNLVFYTPHISQAQEIINKLEDDEDIKIITTIEILQRRWEIDEKRLRPKHNMLGHTAFLTFARIFKR